MWLELEDGAYCTRTESIFFSGWDWIYPVTRLGLQSVSKTRAAICIKVDQADILPALYIHIMDAAP